MRTSFVQVWRSCRARSSTLATVGAAVLSEGGKFLYAQAGEALKRWRERKSAGAPLTAEASAWLATIDALRRAVRGRG